MKDYSISNYFSHIRLSFDDLREEKIFFPGFKITTLSGGSAWDEGYFWDCEFVTQPVLQEIESCLANEEKEKKIAIHGFTIYRW